MTRPTRLSDEIPNLLARLGSEVPSPPALSSNTVDRGSGMDVFVPGGGDIALVQSNELAGSSPTEVPLNDTPIAGNLLIFAVATRGGTGDPTTPAGWTANPDGTATVGSGSIIATFWKISDGTETGFLMTPDGGGGWIGGISEWSGNLAFLDSTETTGTTNPLTGASVTPTAGAAALVLGAFLVNTGDFLRPSAPTGDWLELHDDQLAGGFGPGLWAAYQILASASGSYTPAGTFSAGDGAAYAEQSVVFTASGNPVNGGGNATDGDPDTYVEITGGGTIDIDLGARYEIVSSEARVGTTSGGSRTFTIYGANEADFSDAVVLDSTTFTASGFFAGQDISFSWERGQSFRYYRLENTVETWRLYSWELYEPTFGGSHDHDGIYIPETIFDHLGDLVVGTGPDAYSALPSVASNVYTLTTEQDGDLEWGPFVRSLVSNGSNTLQRPDIALTAGTGIAFSVSSNGLTITNTGSSGGDGGTPIAAGSNSTHVGETSTAGASSSLWSPFDHRHAGVAQITSSSSNTLQRGTVNLRAGSGVAFGATDTDGDGEFDTLTISSTASGGVGGSPASSLTPWVVPVNVWISTTNTNWDSNIAGQMHSTGDQNASLEFEGIALDAGTWLIEGWFYRSTNHGIVTFRLDGSDVGTVDLYGSALDNYESATSTFAVAAADVYQLRLIMATKNASSGGYYGLVKWLQLRRTA